MHNNRGPQDSRRLMTGKDGLLYNEEGTLLATFESFTAQVNWQNATYQPLGDAQQHEIWQAYSVSLSASECIVEDSAMYRELVSAMATGVPPMWTFQGVLKGRNKSEQRMIFRDSVPTGTIDLQNFQPGDLVKRAWNFTVNRPPELQKLLTMSN